MIWNRKKKMTRAQALERAVDMSEPGDTVEIHSKDCFYLTMCVCNPVTLMVGGRRPKAPLGFRMRRND